MLLAGKFVRLNFIHRHMRCHSIGKLEMLFILAFHENRKDLFFSSLSFTTDTGPLPMMLW